MNDRRGSSESSNLKRTGGMGWLRFRKQICEPKQTDSEFSIIQLE